MVSKQPRKQRKALYNAPPHVRRKQVASHLSEELLLKYNRRSLPVVSGDEVKVLRGDHAGEGGRVVEVDVKKRRVTVNGITHKKADGTDIAMPLDASNLLITKLNLEDQRRRDKVGETEAPAPKKTAKPKAAGKQAASAGGEKETAGTGAKDAPKAAASGTAASDEGGEEE